MGAQVIYLSSAGPIAIGETVRDRAPLRVVADFADESYSLVQLPKARGSDRRALLERRLAEAFPDTPYRLGLPLAGAPAAQAPTHALCALPAEPIERFVREALDRAREIAGIWTVSALAAWYLKVAGVRAARGLVLIRTPAGVRHVFVLGGLPVVSRLVADPVEPAAATDHARELERTLQYLRSTRLIGADEPLPAWAWGLKAEAVALRSAIRWQTCPPVKPCPHPDDAGLSALLALLERRAPRAQFAPPAARVHWRARRWAHAIYSGAGACAIAAAIATGVQLRFAQDQRSQATHLQSALAAAQQQSARALAAFRHAGVSASEVTATLAAYDEQARSAPRIDAAIRTAAGAFARTATWRLDELHWQVAAAADGAAPCAAEHGDAAAAVLRLRGRTIDAPLRSIEADQREFEAALRAAAGVKFVAERAPLAIGVEPLRGGADAPRGQPFAYCLFWSATPR